MAAALSIGIGSSFHTRKSSAKEQMNGKRNISRTLVIVCCDQTRAPKDPSRSSPEKKKEKDQKKGGVMINDHLQIISKLGKGLKDSLGPKRKGDWKDLVLMSLSFAVYVYISQKIVCTYCAWMSLLNHPIW